MLHAYVFSDKKYYGVNVENCSYSLTVCRKNCITSAITGYKLSDAKYMIIITNAADTITPCGVCRQIL